MPNINKVMNDAIEYILTHLEEEIDVKAVAEHCHFSEFYFNRMFKAAVGESVYAFVKRRRMERSAFDLSIKPDSSITQIAAQYGYSASNFSTAFRKHYDESPHSFKHTREDKTGVELESYEYFDQRVRDVFLDPFTVLYERYIGSYYDLEHQWDDFIKRHIKYKTEYSKYIEISYDDPVITEEGRCIYDICMSIDKPGPEHVLTMDFEGGHYKAFRYQGKIDDIFQSFQGLFQVWFLQSDIELDRRKILTIYEGTNCETKEVIMDICIPC